MTVTLRGPLNVEIKGPGPNSLQFQPEGISLELDV